MGDRLDRARGVGWARWARRPAGAERGRRARRPLWQEIPLLVAIALALAFGVKTFGVQAFSIPSGSMQNTLQKGDRVLVDKLTPWFGAKPARGDVVVFHDPGDWLRGAPAERGGPLVRALSLVGLMPSADEKDLIKRVIAVGGDTVTCTPGAPVRVNGVALDEPYIYPGATPCDDYPVGTVTVPADRIWVMGDHRNGSEDSRAHELQHPGDGFVPVSGVIGRAIVVAWPLGRWAILPEPATFGQPGLAAGRASGPGAGPGPGYEPVQEPAPVAAGLLGLAGALPLLIVRRRRRRAAAGLGG
ncbi:signal peptidase I [Kitasatospora sp. NPDC057015]|uniref:signal peptidase I n=1 Tax=Kitasatospora sp. NPDC057015 TaxID=3346001 RepID=UPI0036337886